VSEPSPTDVFFKETVHYHIWAGLANCFLAAGFFGYGGQTVDGGCYGADFDLSIVFCKTIKTKV
jgi:hypothetical protein